MRIKFVEVSNFRKLKSTHIDFDKKTTIFVGANSSGKTSAMVALRNFLLSPNRLVLRDITIANWTKSEARGFLFSYEKPFGAKPLSDQDRKNAAEGADTGVDRTRRLLCVTCTRAAKSLALVAYTENPDM